MAINEGSVLSSLTTKAEKDLSNLGTISSTYIDKIVDAILEDSFTIIYPFGTKENPGTIKNNTRYIIPNPFPGYTVNCRVEIRWNDEWMVAPWII